MLLTLSLALLLAEQVAPPSPPLSSSSSSSPDAATPTPDPELQATETPDLRAGPAVPTAGGDVVVTARRRSESVQKVPIAISVIGQSALVETGANSVDRLTQLQPSLQFYSTNPRNSAINIRGLGSPFGLTNDGIEQGVGVYVDQVFQGRIAAATFDFVDVERIEVLRGPQGTLYGKNTTAGAINIVSRPPSFTTEAAGELSIGNYDLFQAKGTVSGPVVGDQVAVRLSASVTSRRGAIRNVLTREWVNGQDNLGLRGAMLIRAAPNLDLTVSADYNRQDPNCCAQIYVRTGSTQRPLNRQFDALAAAFDYRPPSTDPFDRLTDLDTPLRAKQSIGGASLRAEWDVGPGTLTSVSAWRFWNWDPSNDRDFTGLPITTVSQNPSRQRQVSQELRFASASGGAVDYVLGAFYFRQTIDTSGAQVQGAAASRWLLNPASANSRDPSVLNGLRSQNAISFTNTSAALFGQLTWRATERLRVQPGLRVNYDKKAGSYVAVVTTGTGSTTLNNDQRGVLAPQRYDPRFSDWNLSGDFTLSYDLADAVMAYATYARSFKSGGINLSGLPLDAANNPILSAGSVDPERVDHLELGLKTQFANGRATVNLAAFQTQTRDYQATVSNGQLGVLRGYLANADKVRVRGVEVDALVRPIDRLDAYVNGAFTDARYVRFTDAPCPPELSGGPAASATNPASPAGTPGGFSPAACDVSGQWLPGVSRWAFSYGLEYRQPTGRGDAYVGFDGSYRSRFSSNPSRSLYNDIDGYALANFRLGFRANAGWEAFAWLRNAFDEQYFEVLANQSGGTGLVVGQPGDPRTYGITVLGRF